MCLILFIFSPVIWTNLGFKYDICFWKTLFYKDLKLFIWFFLQKSIVCFFLSHQTITSLFYKKDFKLSKNHNPTLILVIFSYIKIIHHIQEKKNVVGAIASMAIHVDLLLVMSLVSGGRFPNWWGGMGDKNKVVIFFYLNMFYIHVIYSFFSLLPKNVFIYDTFLNFYFVYVSLA